MKDGMKARLSVLLRALKWTGITLGIFSLGMSVSALALILHYERQIQQAGLESFFTDYPRWLALSLIMSGFYALVFLVVMELLAMWLVPRPMWSAVRNRIIADWQMIRGKDERVDATG